MKTRSVLLLVLCTLFFASCKNEQKQPEAAAAESADKKENFSVEVDVITDKDDDIPLYYTEDGTTNFNGDKAVWYGMKGQAGKQTVVLNLSEEIIPTAIRIDFGIKKGEQQADVTLERFKMNYYGKSFEAKGSDFLNYFIKNDSVQTEVDPAKGTITFKKNPKSQLVRFYYPQQRLLDELKKITQ